MLINVNWRLQVMEMETRIKRIISELVEDKEIQNTISSETNIIDDIGLDSLQMINFILMLEDEFDIEIDFDEFEYEYLLKFSTLVEFIKGKL